jgi:hypothetical protein
MLHKGVAKCPFQSSSVAVAAGSQANGDDLAVEYKITVVVGFDAAGLQSIRWNRFRGLERANGEEVEWRRNRTNNKGLFNPRREHNGGVE